MGLIFPRNPLAFPGGAPGYNPAHLASGPKMRFSGVATNSGFVSLLGGNVTSHGSMIYGSSQIGPIATFAAAGAYQSIPGINETPAAATSAIILYPTASPGVVSYFTNDGNTAAGVVFQMNSLVTRIFTNSTAINGNTLTTNDPWFVVQSLYAGIFVNVTRNLRTGKVATFTSSGNVGITGSSSSSYDIGGNSGSGGALGFGMAAVMYSASGLSLNQCLEWIADPWSFWYPPTVGQAIFSSLRGSGGNSAALAYTEASDTIAIAATPPNLGTVAVTELGDGVGTMSGNMASLAFTEPADSQGGQSGTPVPPPAATPYWHGPPAMWPYRIDFTGPVIYVRAAIQITGPACVGFRIGDVYFRRRALNYLDNIPDDFTAPVVPCFASAPTQFATLAYTEPPDQIVILSQGGSNATLAYTEPADNIAITSEGGCVFILTSGTSFTVPPCLANAKIEGIGGGAGGGVDGSAGGGGGAYAVIPHAVLTPGSVITYGIGPGGLGGLGGVAQQPSPGGDTTFGSILIAKGGDAFGGGGQASLCLPSAGAFSGGNGGVGATGLGGAGGGGGAGGPNGPGGHGGDGGNFGNSGNGGGGGGAGSGGGAGVKGQGSSGTFAAWPGGNGGAALDGTPGGLGGTVTTINGSPGASNAGGGGGLGQTNGTALNCGLGANGGGTNEPGGGGGGGGGWSGLTIDPPGSAGGGNGGGWGAGAGSGSRSEDATTGVGVPGNGANGVIILTGL